MNIKTILDALAILREAGQAFNRGVEVSEQMRLSKLCYASEYALKLALEKDCPDVMISADRAVCSYDKQPCPPPFEGRGRGDSQCAQNGICQRVKLDELQKLSEVMTITAGKIEDFRKPS